MILIDFSGYASVRTDAVQVRISQTVLLAAQLAACSCATPAKDHPAAVSTGLAQPSSTGAAPPSPEREPAAPGPSATSTLDPAKSAVSAATLTGSAYFGCGAPIPVARLWDETTESQVLEAITAAKRCAGAQGRKLLLEFVAPWCADCREMAKLDDTAVVDETLRARFERVRINVGKWDRHEALRENYRVRALATYIIIDPKTSRVLAQTTLEPITKQRGKKLTADDWATWLRAH
jgi:hypothetical protein